MPFWRHPQLVPLVSEMKATLAPVLDMAVTTDSSSDDKDLEGLEGNESGGEDSDGDVIDTEGGIVGGQMFRERMKAHVELL